MAPDGHERPRLPNARSSLLDFELWQRDRDAFYWFQLYDRPENRGDGHLPTPTHPEPVASGRFKTLQYSTWERALFDSIASPVLVGYSFRVRR